MPLQTVGTATCPECGETVRVFRRGFRDPQTGRAIHAIALHWRGERYCPGQGKRVATEQITPLEQD